MNTTFKETFELAMVEINKKFITNKEEINLCFSDGPFVRTIFKANDVMFAELEIYENKNVKNIYRVSTYNMINLLAGNVKEKEVVVDPPMLLGVMTFAYANYENGFDTLIECYTKEEIIAAYGDATTVKQAIQNIDENLGISIYEANRKEIQATIF